ncbi:MAG: hypothetical protein ACRD43_05560, partial [Pyrinomonadaceae bacterium]
MAFPFVAARMMRHGSPEPRLASSGTTQLLTVQGSGAGLNNGDYVSDGNGLDSPHRYFIEVPPGQTHLSVQIFDPDIGLGGAAEEAAGRDRARGTYN